MLIMNEQILVNLPVAFQWQVIWAAMELMWPHCTVPFPLPVYLLGFLWAASQSYTNPFPVHICPFVKLH